MFQFVQSRPELLRDRWIVYSTGPWDSTFFSAAGCDVVNGLKVRAGPQSSSCAGLYGGAAGSHESKRVAPC